VATTVRFVVPGVAATKGSTRAFIPKGWNRPVITNNDPRAKAWQQLIAQHASDALAASNLQPFADGAMILDVWFYFPRPQKLLTKKYAAIDVPHTTKPDADKCLRVVKDALSRVVYRDDSSVIDAYVHKRYCAAGELPRAEITVRAVQWELPKPIIHSDGPTLFGEEALYGEAEVR
jgi:Holliday junction resolvase RusA-like endonuclease